MGIYSVADTLAAWTHFEQGRKDQRIQLIVMHSTEGTNSLRWLRQDSMPAVSCHVLVARNGMRYRIVRDDDTAWHAGRSSVSIYTPSAEVNVNHVSLGLELEHKTGFHRAYPEAQVVSAVEQVVEWFGAHGWLPIVGHGTVDHRKRDLAGFPWFQFASLLGRGISYDATGHPSSAGSRSIR